jgi:hypothetical protein
MIGAFIGGMATGVFIVLVVLSILSFALEHRD